MRRRSTRLVAASGAVLSAVLLAACDKPLPKVTVQSGALSTTITPSTYCFDATHCRNSSRPDLPVIAAVTDGKVFIDVPREVAHQGWAVQALTLDGSKSLGGSGTIRGRHSYRVASSAGGGSPFIVEIDQIRDGKADGSRWSFLVKIAQDT